MRNRFLWLSLAAVIALGTLAYTYTLQYAVTLDGKTTYYQKWGSGTISMAYNLTFPSQFASSNPNPSLVQAVIKNDMQNAGCDGVNVITFNDQSAGSPAPTGSVLAFTYVFWVQVPGGASGTCPAIPTTFPGQIYETDITFNIGSPFSTDGRYINGSALNQANDIEGTLIHELGHVLGLHHSTQENAIMVGAAQQSFPNRSLATDDIAGIQAAYGVNNFGGSVSGKITDGLGAPVLGAVVHLVDNKTGMPAVDGISDSTGAYSMIVPAGTYNVWVKPLDVSPTSPAFYTSQYNTANPTAFNAFSLPSPITVAASGNTAIPTFQALLSHTALFQDIVVSTPNANNSGFANFGANLVSLRRAGVGSAYPSNTGTYKVCGYGAGLAGPITTSVPGATSTGSTISDTCNIGALISQTMSFPATSAPGFYDVYTSNDVQPGGLQVTTNPFIGAGGIIDSAANTKTYAAGSFISIYGLDLTTQTIGNAVFPVPTQLGGVMVRVGDRFAPIFFVSPGQVNAMIPYEAVSCSTGSSTGCTVDVQVQVGNNSLFDYGTITVVASAPKLFSIDSTGSGQGAIQDGSAAGCPAACPIANSANPAAAGDALVIYASGLGQTSPAAIDGLAGTGTTAGATVTFSTSTATKTVSAVYTGVTSCCSALYQVNAALPAGLGTGTVNVQITDSLGNKSNTVTIQAK